MVSNDFRCWAAVSGSPASEQHSISLHVAVAGCSLAGGLFARGMWFVCLGVVADTWGHMADMGLQKNMH
jgi:hypothetical protein